MARGLFHGPWSRTQDHLVEFVRIFACFFMSFSCAWELTTKKLFPNFQQKFNVFQALTTFYCSRFLEVFLITFQYIMYSWHKSPLLLVWQNAVCPSQLDIRAFHFKENMLEQLL